MDATRRFVLSWYGLTGFTHFLGDLAIIPMARGPGVVLPGRACVDTSCPVGCPGPGWLWRQPPCLGSVGILLAVDALYPAWFVGLFGYWFWVLAVAVTSLVRLRRSRTAPAGLRSKRRAEGRSVRSHGGFEPSAWRSAAVS